MVTYDLGGWANFPRDLFIPNVVASLGSQGKSIVITYDTGAFSNIGLTGKSLQDLGVNNQKATPTRVGPLSVINGNPPAVDDGQIIGNGNINMAAMGGDRVLTPHYDQVNRMSIQYQRNGVQVATLDIHNAAHRKQINNFSPVGQGTPYPNGTTFYSTDVILNPLGSPNIPNPTYKIVTSGTTQVNVGVKYPFLPSTYPAVWDTGAGLNTIPKDIAEFLFGPVSDGDRVDVTEIALVATDAGGNPINFRLRNVPFVVDRYFDSATLGAPIFVHFQQMTIPSMAFGDTSIGII